MKRKPEIFEVAMPTKLDLLKRDLEQAEEYLFLVARLVSERHPALRDLASAIERLDACVHHVYVEEAAIAA